MEQEAIATLDYYTNSYDTSNIPIASWIQRIKENENAIKTFIFSHPNETTNNLQSQ